MKKQSYKKISPNEVDEERQLPQRPSSESLYTIDDDSEISMSDNDMKLLDTLAIQNITSGSRSPGKNSPANSRRGSLNGQSAVVDISEEQADTPEESEIKGLDEFSSWWEKLWVLYSKAIPTIIAFTLSMSSNFINLTFAGTYKRPGAESVVFAGISLANVFANVTFLSLLIGLSGAIETLGSQNNGHKNYREVGIVLQRSYIVLSVLTIPVFFAWHNSAKIFNLVGIEPAVCEVIQNYLHYRMYGIPIDIINISFEKYLMSIGVMQPTAWANVSMNVCLLCFNTVFVHHFKLGYECLAYSWILSAFISGRVQYFTAIRYEAVQRTLQPLSWDAFKNISEFVSLGVPGTIMLCSEWWAYEILTVFASMLGTSQVAAQTIIVQVAALAFMTPLGLGIATASMIGNSLGAGKKQLAIQISSISLCSIVVLQSIIAICIYFFGKHIFLLFTDDPKVYGAGMEMIPFLSIFTVFDAYQGAAAGVLRGTGRQNIGAVCNVFAFYAIGIPLAYTFTFKLKHGVSGLVSGNAFGALFQCIVITIIIFGYKDKIFTCIIHDTKEGMDDSMSPNNPMLQGDIEMASISVTDNVEAVI